MGDLIDRKSLLEKIHFERIDGQIISFVRTEDVQSEPSVDRWHEGTPKETGKYLVLTQKDDIGIARYYTFDGWSGQYKKCVKKWQYLPEGE